MFVTAKALQLSVDAIEREYVRERKHNGTKVFFFRNPLEREREKEFVR
jgi:hypothetical protein